MSKLNIEWRFSKSWFWVLCTIAFSIPASGSLWILLEFDLPFIHGGDRIIGRSILFLWWLCCTILIFGWRSTDNDKKNSPI